MRFKNLLCSVVFLVLYCNVASAYNNYYIVAPAAIIYQMPQPVYCVPVMPVVPPPPPQLIPAPVWMQPMMVAPPVVVVPPQVIVIENRWEQRRSCFPILFPKY